MNNKFKNYLDNEFSHVVMTQEMIDFKDELLSNLIDKYEEYISLGFTEDESFIETIKSIGNLNELINEKQDQVQLSMVKNKPFDQILYNNQSSDQYIFDKITNSLNLYTYITVGISFFSTILFFILLYSLNKVPYRTNISFIIQLAILVITSIIFFIGTYKFNFTNDRIKNRLNNEGLWNLGNKIIKNRYCLFGSSLILNLLITLPYPVLLTYLFKDKVVKPITAILSFPSYIKYLPLFLFISIIIIPLYINLVDKYFDNKKGIQTKIISEKMMDYHKLLIAMILCILFIIFNPLPLLIYIPIGIGLLIIFIRDLIYNYKNNRFPNVVFFLLKVFFLVLIFLHLEFAKNFINHLNVPNHIRINSVNYYSYFVDLLFINVLIWVLITIFLLINKLLKKWKFSQPLMMNWIFTFISLLSIVKLDFEFKRGADCSSHYGCITTYSYETTALFLLSLIYILIKLLFMMLNNKKKKLEKSK